MKTVLITGSSRGIGAGCASLFADNGYNVIINYNKSKTAAEELCKALPSAIAVMADITNPSDVSRMLSLCEYHFGSLDVLINNAGIAYNGVFDAMSTEDMRKIIETDLLGAMSVTKAALPMLRNSKSGRIINISSMWGVSGGSCEVAYSAAKAGLIGFTKALAREVGPSGITVNCIAPGYIDTEMNSGYSADTVASVIDRTPLCRIGSPFDIASAALFLASDSASFITAQVLGVDGGYI